MVVGAMAEKNEKRKRRARKWYFWFFVMVFLVISMVYFYYQFPKQEAGPQQPIYFSHRVHAGVKKIDCHFCHPFVERSEHAGLPEMEKCFYCHEYIIPTHPQITKEKKHYKTKDPVPWVRIFYVPDHVQFKHEPHISWGKLECVACHGQVEKMDRLLPVDFKMGFCINCHQEKKAQLDCWLSCHH
jgi:hypothetical protein